MGQGGSRPILYFRRVHTCAHAPNLQLGALQPQQLLSVHAAGAELGHQVLQVEAQEPAGHLLGAPVGHVTTG